tara:strand:- start:1872 stop:2444 length:573 start_codon:yes stop_codon:yes gene_type:complete
MNIGDLASHITVIGWAEALSAKLNSFSSSKTKYEIQIREDEDRSLFCPVVVMETHGVKKSFILTREFFNSADYKLLNRLALLTEDLRDRNILVSRGDKSTSADSFEKALEWLETEAIKGQTRSRYKGLGEMNPDQLWETTMDPKIRTMLRVTIEDAVAANVAFSSLMGDQVEPRREFIEDNALAVANLDI